MKIEQIVKDTLVKRWGQAAWDEYIEPYVDRYGQPISIEFIRKNHYTQQYFYTVDILYGKPDTVYSKPDTEKKPDAENDLKFQLTVRDLRAALEGVADDIPLVSFEDGNYYPAYMGLETFKAVWGTDGRGECLSEYIPEYDEGKKTIEVFGVG